VSIQVRGESKKNGTARPIPSVVGSVDATLLQRRQPEANRISQRGGRPAHLEVRLHDGHPLNSGYVVRYATTNPNGQTILNNKGEGKALLQSPSSPVADLIKNQWLSQSREIIDKIR
jgi:hypothetical protein